MICTLALMTALTITVKCQDYRRPFYVIGHIVNSIPQVSEFLKLGANAIESNVEFSKNGTALRTYHEFPCDCYRKCRGSANIVDFFQYIRRATGFRRSVNKETLLLLLLNLELYQVPPESKYNAGVDLTNKLLQHLWEGGLLYPMNVLLVVSRTSDENVIKGVIDTIRNSAPRMSPFNYMNYVGFDVAAGFFEGWNNKLEDIAKMYKRLGVYRHRWQGDGTENCGFYAYNFSRLREAISIRDSKKTEGYVDKVYYWTTDEKSVMRRVIRMGVDAVITNNPDRLRSVLAEGEFENTVRLATFLDGPFMRFQTKGTERGLSKYDSDTDEMVEEDRESDFEPFPLPVSPRKPRPFRIHAIRHSDNELPPYGPLRPFY